MTERYEGQGHQFREAVLAEYGRQWRVTWERTGDARQADWAAREVMRGMVERQWERQTGSRLDRIEDDPASWWQPATQKTATP